MITFDEYIKDSWFIRFHSCSKTRKTDYGIRMCTIPDFNGEPLWKLPKNNVTVLCKMKTKDAISIDEYAVFIKKEYERLYKNFNNILGK